MKNIAKKLANLVLGFALVLGVGISVGSSVNKEAIGVRAETKTLIIDGSKLTTTATTSNTTYQYDGFNIVFSSGAKNQTSKSGTNKFTDNAILIGKKGTYIYNQSPIGSKITQFEVYANIGASTKASIGINFSDQAITSYNSSSTYTYTQTLSTVDKVYDASTKLSSNAKYFWYQVTSDYNSQVQFRITYEEAIAKTLNGLTLSDNRTDKQKLYYEGDTFKTDGLTVTANYSDAEDEDVTNQISWDKTILKTTDTLVTGTFKDKTVTVPITVNAYTYEGDGTLENPYTIDDAVRLSSLGGKNDVFVKGTGKPNWYSSTNTFTVKFPDNKNTKFTFYSLYADKNKTTFTSLITLGQSDNTEVLAFGNISGTTSQLDSGCYIYDYKATSITASTPTKTGLKAGDTVSSLTDLGVNVTANIEISNEQRDVTSEATIDKTTLVKGANTITVRYTQTNKYSGLKTNNTELTTTITLDNIPQKATKVEITSSVNEVNVGESITLTAKVSPDDTTDPTIIWTSNDESIAMVNKDTGVVTGVKAGQVTISACCDEAKDSVIIEVKDPNNVLSELIITGTCQKEYFVGETFDPIGLTVTGKYTDGVTEINITNYVTWPTSPFTEANDAYEVIVSYTYTENNIEKTMTETGAIISIVNKVLSSITVSNQKTSYTVSDTSLDTSSMIVTASYENTTRTEDVSNKDTIQVTNNIDFTTLGNKEVTVSYTEGNITKSVNYTINIGVGNMTLKVKTDTGITGYKKVTENKADWSGTYLIVYEAGDKTTSVRYAFNGLDAQNGYYDITLDSNGIVSESQATVTVTIAKMTGGYSIKVNGSKNDGKYLSGTNESNIINFNDSASLNTIEYIEGNVQITSNTSVLRFNPANNNMRFRYFKSSGYTDQKAICLYEYYDGIATVEHSVSEVLYIATQEANKALQCGSQETGVWVDGSYDEETAKGYFELLEESDLNLVKNADANKEGNLVEYFLWKYDYLVSTGKISNFLSRNVTSSKSNFSYKVNDSDTSIMIIVVIALTSLTAMGGYLFIRKRKVN